MIEVNLTPRAHRCIFLGYPSGQLFYLDNKKAFISRDVHFINDIFPFSTLSEDSPIFFVHYISSFTPTQTTLVLWKLILMHILHHHIHQPLLTLLLIFQINQNSHQLLLNMMHPSQRLVLGGPIELTLENYHHKFKITSVTLFFSIMLQISLLLFQWSYHPLLR